MGTLHSTTAALVVGSMDRTWFRMEVSIILVRSKDETRVLFVLLW
jgi:hypothetical protein